MAIGVFNIVTKTTKFSFIGLFDLSLRREATKNDKKNGND